MKRFCLHIILLSIVTVAMADKVGTWKLYPSYSNISEVQYTKADSSEVFVLASGNLFAYYDSDKTFSEFMIEGAESATGTSYGILSDRDISHIAWCATVKKLLIAYSDGMIDLLDARDRSNPYVTSIVGLKETTLFSDKTVSSIYVGGQYAYLTTESHIIKIDVKEEYIVQTYNTTKVTEVEGMTDATKMEPVTLDYKFGSETKPDGPASNYCWRLYKHDGKIFSTAGNFSAGLYGFDRKGEVNYMHNNTWNQLPMPDGYIAANCMAFDPIDNNHLWVGGRSGLIEYQGGLVKTLYTPKNSTLSPLYGSDKGNSVITSMTYDSSNNLWVMNGWTDPAIQKYSNSGVWTTFPHKDVLYDDWQKEIYTSMDHQGVYISPTNGYMWWVHNYWGTSAVLCYDCKNDKLYKVSSFTNQDGSILTPVYMPDIKEDENGNIWVASYDGPFYIPADNLGTDFSSVEQPKVNRTDGSGLADYLLNSVHCRSIKFDGAGKKWIGTEENGIYVISADNQEQINHFTIDNSPLISNVIYDILIDDETGVVYFATDNGLCSYQSDVTESYGELDKDKVYAYPNPVTPEYNGDITIVGLSNGCTLKIVNTAGNIVHSGRCNGGSYTWNGCDGTGNRVASGVYMVLVANADADDGCVTKIAVVK